MRKTTWQSILVAVLAMSLCLGLTGKSLARPDDRDGSPAKTAAAWSNGWVPIDPGETLTFTHNLGGAVEDYTVQLWFLDDEAGGLGIHTLGYGGEERANGVYSGATWHSLTSSTIKVYRLADDTTVDRVRVVIRISEPEHQYCTAWSNVGQGSIAGVHHGLGGDEDDYTVKLWFKEVLPKAGIGIHHQAYGSMDDWGQRVGAHWWNLTANDISVYREVNDHYVGQFLLCVTEPDARPRYDSGWQNIDPGETLVLAHNLRGSVGNYVVNVDAKCLPPCSYNIHQYLAGGDGVYSGGAEYEQGFYWKNLTGTSIRVVRGAADQWANQVRVRIWAPYSVYLPAIKKWS